MAHFFLKKKRYIVIQTDSKDGKKKTEAIQNRTKETVFKEIKTVERQMIKIKASRRRVT